MRPILGDPVRGQVPGLPGLGYVGPPEGSPKHKGVPLPNDISPFSLPKRHAPERVLCLFGTKVNLMVGGSNSPVAGRPPQRRDELYNKLLKGLISFNKFQ